MDVFTKLKRLYTHPRASLAPGGLSWPPLPEEQFSPPGVKSRQTVDSPTPGLQLTPEHPAPLHGLGRQPKAGAQTRRLPQPFTLAAGAGSKDSSP